MGNKRKLIYSLGGLIAVAALTSASFAQTQNRYANYGASAQQFNQHNYSAQTASHAYYQPQHAQHGSEHGRHQAVAYRDTFPFGSPHSRQDNSVAPPRRVKQRGLGRRSTSAPSTFGPRYN